MSNDYFNHTSRLSRHTLGRAENMNAIFDAIAAGFEKFPDILNINRANVTFAVDSGSANALVVALPQSLTAYADGLYIVVKVAATNTGAATINVDGLGARSIKLPTGGDPQAADLTAGDIVGMFYDNANTRFVLATPYRSLKATVTLNTVVNSGAAAGDVATLVDDGSGGLTPEFQAPATDTALMPKAGGTFTGEVTFGAAFHEKRVSVSSSSGTLTIDCSAGNMFSVTLSENITTLTFTNVPASPAACGFVLEVIQDASASGYTVAWGASVAWPGKTAPTLTADASARDWFTFVTDNGGTVWDAQPAGQNRGIPA